MGMSTGETIRYRLIVHVVDEQFKPTGEKLICDINSLQLVGYVH